MIGSLRTRRILHACGIAICLAGSVSAATITVTSSADSGPGTLREAITTANGDAASDTILFDAGVTAITLSTALPGVIEPLILDGTVNHTVGTFVELNGASLVGDGLTLGAANCEVYGMYIHGFAGIGIDSTAANVIVGNATKRNVISGNTGVGIRCGAPGASVRGNYVGTNTTGLVAEGNGSDGILVLASNAVIGSAGAGNVVSGNGTHGILVFSAANSTIQGNIIGLNATGNAAIGNASEGVAFNDSDSDGTLIGGPAAGEGNVISGNGINQIYVSGSAISIQGNLIGTNASGTAGFGVVANGIRITASSVEAVLIGGTGAGEGNVISGNARNGVLVDGDNTMIQGNAIGLNLAGTASLGNGLDGVFLGALASGVTIGGATPGARNIISGNFGSGILVRGTGNTVQGNYIGTDASNTLALGNGDAGIAMEEAGTIIGNTIRHNAGDNVIVRFTVNGVTISANSIDGNCIRPISMDGSIPANDALDVDTGANNYQNHPIVDPGATPLSTTVTGTLSSEASTTYTVEVYFSTTAHGSGSGPGEVYLGTTSVITDAAGNTPWSIGITPVGSAGFFTALATAPDGSTSCFSPAVVVAASSIQDWSGYR